MVVDENGKALDEAGALLDVQGMAAAGKNFKCRYGAQINHLAANLNEFGVFFARTEEYRYPVPGELVPELWLVSGAEGAQAGGKRYWISGASCRQHLVERGICLQRREERQVVPSFEKGLEIPFEILCQRLVTQAALQALLPGSQPW